MALNCKADLKHISNWTKECGNCNACLPTSALHYPFQRDLANSQMLVDEIKKFVKDSTGLDCRETDTFKNPDLVVLEDNNKLIARIESKFLEGKAFIKVAQMLSDKLYPKETLVVDEPKLISYFSCKDSDKKEFDREIPIFIIRKFDRPCPDVGGICLFQEIDILRSIYLQKGNSRKFIRRTSPSDFASGLCIGVIEKFHFSITPMQSN